MRRYGLIFMPPVVTPAPMPGGAEREESRGSSYNARRLPRDGPKPKAGPFCSAGDVVVVVIDDPEEPRLCSLPYDESGADVAILCDESLCYRLSILIMLAEAAWPRLLAGRYSTTQARVRWVGRRADAADDDVGDSSLVKAAPAVR